MMVITNYIKSVSKRYKTGISSEHSYRGDLETLIRELVANIEITNEPGKITDCGNPDYVITRKDIPIGYIEAKDIGKDLNHSQYKEQFDRYKQALDNLIITDYLNFLFFQNGELLYTISIGEIKDKTIKPLTDNFDNFTNLIKDFCTYQGQTIKDPKKLAQMMASKARLLQNTLEQAVSNDDKTQNNSSLKEQYETFKDLLIHDLTISQFSDVYAQTLAYGMFAARLHDTTLNNFSRFEASSLIPKTNPFLRKLFGHVLLEDIDDRMNTTINNLVDVFRATDIRSLLTKFDKSNQNKDPIIHFYETFLKEYDKKLSIDRGVWYTPQPVVNFIVRVVDDILKTDFNLKDGISDTTKTTITIPAQGKQKKQKKQVHKVQILDPATGTGTFLASIIEYIHKNKFKNMQGAWSDYVDKLLIPRLNGFELLMAPYAMAHLKLDMLLNQTGYKPTKENQRFKIYLTNSLEEHNKDIGNIFASWLSDEANEANHIKRDAPVMVVIGNPPYAVSSSNRGDWIMNLIQDYKKNLNEGNKQPLSDDYIKFIRYGQHMIDKNGEGILAYISNNSFIDGITHRLMRKSLLTTFDKIYILDLHGNSNKQEINPNGGEDENVFKIKKVGVSINIFVKNETSSKDLAEVFHFDLYGKQQAKYDFLNNNDLKSVQWQKLDYKDPDYFFVPKDFKEKSNYDEGFSVSSIMNNLNPGIESGRDDFFIDFTKEYLELKIKSVFDDKKSDALKSLYKIKNTSSFKFENNLSTQSYDNNFIRKISYRPFDIRFSYYDRKLQRRASYDTFKHIIKDNIGLIVKRGFDEKNAAPVFVVNNICDRRGWTRSGMQGAESIAPLYLYLDEKSDGIFTEKERKPNLNMEIVEKIADKIKLEFTPEKQDNKTTFAPIDILDYIYAVLHSPKYREKYQEFLKIDFPRVPYPQNKKTFWQLVDIGGQLREVHLLQSLRITKPITTYPITGDNKITTTIGKKDFVITDKEKQTGKIFINEKQYFDNIPLTAWQFYIGGYQPAQKWLKDRKNRKLNYDDIMHYQKIIVALHETDKLMHQIDKIEVV